MGWVEAVGGAVTWVTQSLADFLVPESCPWCGRRTAPGECDGTGLAAPARCLAVNTRVRLLGVIPVVNRPFCRRCLSRLEPCGRPHRLGCCGFSSGAGWTTTADGDLFLHRPDSAAGVVPAVEPCGGREVPLLVCAPFFMNDISLDIIRFIKFSGRRSLVSPAGAAIAYALRTQIGDGGIDTLVPVPMHRSALRRRGFNQAGLLARAISRTTGVPAAHGALVKVARTPRQSQSTRSRRAENVRGAFRWAGGGLADKHVCLVDDLVTSGATAAACASVLMAAGARRVTVACLAKSL